MPGPSRPILDPLKIGPIVGATSVSILPKDVRRLGHAPAIEQLLPGDLLLFSPTHRNFVSSRISSAQEQGGFLPEHASWTHAAIFLYDDVMVEALPIRGVVQSSIYARVPNHRILIRRNPALDERVRYRIALRALGMIGKRYSHLGILSLGWDLFKGLWSNAVLAGNRQVVICSQVFADAHSEMTNTLLPGCPLNRATTPADLSATTGLTDVAIDWKRLV
jgi:hypothetical protein